MSSRRKPGCGGAERSVTLAAYRQGWTVLFSEQTDKNWEEKADEWGKRPKSECSLSRICV